LFTKVAGKGRFGRRASAVGDGERDSDRTQSCCKPGAVQLELSDDAVDSIEDNVKRFQEFLKQRFHHIDSRFSPWRAVEL